MSESKILYRQILKSTTLFGGVQVFNIIVSILRSKAIALFIGPVGMGIAGLLSSTIDVIYTATSLGLGTSGVKSISQDNATLQPNLELNKTVSVLKQLMWFTGIFGALLTLFFSSWLSKFTFGNNIYTWSFVWLSFTLLIKNISNSNYAVLQGMGKLKQLAKANFYGSFFGLLITLPFYYYLGTDAIVPAILISTTCTMLISIFYSNQLKLDAVKVPLTKIFLEGKGLIQLGVMLSLSGLMTTATAYLLQIYISNSAGVTQVGFYIAGITLLNSYVGIIFTSMSTDYFPRLAAVANDHMKIKNVVEHQAVIAVLIITPLICLFIPFAPLIIKILYSSEFTVIVSMITYGVLGMLFRAVSWSMGYVLIAKGDSKIFIRTSLFFNVLSLIMNVVAFTYWGLEGLGISFCIYYFIHFLVLKTLTFKIYNFYFDADFYKLFGYASLICFSILGANYFEYSLIKIVTLVILTFISLLFSIIQLNKKINLLSFFQKLKK